jgi:hypothetical protein
MFGLHAALVCLDDHDIRLVIGRRDNAMRADLLRDFVPDRIVR